MGNYSGTTRCGYCGERGHNKAGCPKLKARVEELRKTDPGHYLVQRWDTKAEKRTNRATGKRVCAYCKCHRKTIDAWDWRTMDDAERAETGLVGSTRKDRWGHTEDIGVERDTLYGTDGERGVGHSIRACKYRKRDIAARTSEIKARRVDHLRRVLEIGFGPGATVTFSNDGDCANELAGSYVITSVVWKALGLETSDGDEHWINHSVANATHVAHLFNPRPPYGFQKGVTLPMDSLSVEEGAYRSPYASRVATLARPASEEKVRNSIPFGWADATDEGTQTFIYDSLMNDVKSRSKK